MLHLVDGIVHRGDQALNIGAIELRDEAGPEPKQHATGHAIGLVFERKNLVAVELDPIALKHGAERPCALDNHSGMPLEQRLELRLLRHQSMKPLQHARSPLWLASGASQGLPGNPSRGQALGRALENRSLYRKPGAFRPFLSLP